MKLKGQRIFVSGGSRGIGAAIVKHLAAEGARVCFTYSSREDAARQLLETLPKTTTGESHMMLAMNIGQEESVTESIAKGLETFGGFEGLVNNAGITKDQLILRMKTEDFDQVVTTNLRGTFLVTRALLKPMLKARKGSIVNISSIIGTTGNAGQCNYAASKAGIESFSRSVAQEVASRQIRINCVAPGYIVTEMTEILTEEQKKQILSKIPLQIFGNSDDVAEATSFLLSDASKFITGHTLAVNGGMHMG